MSHLDRLRVVLVQSRNPLNIGAAARAMSNFGASHLRVVQPYAPAYREARSAVGATEILRTSRELPSLPEAIADCSLVVGTTAIGHREVQQPLQLLESAAGQIRSHLRKGRVALLFGSEKFGLSNDALSYCHLLLHIPAREAHRSMNLGQAVAVCLYEIARRPAKSAIKPSRKAAASMETMERIHAALFEALQTSGYVKERGGISAEEKLRRMLRRMRVQSADAEVLLGMLRKILWKLHSQEKN